MSSSIVGREVVVPYHPEYYEDIFVVTRLYHPNDAPWIDIENHDDDVIQLSVPYEDVKFI